MGRLDDGYRVELGGAYTAPSGDNVYVTGAANLTADGLSLESNLIEGERVQIWNVTNGERLDTYVIRGRRGSGAICLNGAAARKAQVGDVLIIASYARMEFEEAKTFRPWVVFPDTATNRLVE